MTPGAFFVSSTFWYLVVRITKVPRAPADA